MPTELPDRGSVDLTPPGPDDVERLNRSVLSLIAPDEEPTELQRLLIGAAFEAMTGHPVDLDARCDLGLDDLASCLATRNTAFRTRILQTAILGALVLRPLPARVADRIEAAARELCIDDGMLTVARRFADGDLELAAVDFERNGYTSDWSPERAAALRTRQPAGAWHAAEDDPALAARWDGLERLRAGTLGRRVWEFYRARGFEFPGRPGSAPPLLAQHDWVHVLAGYGTTVESELEVFALIARANDDPRGFSLLAMVVSLFETGYLSEGAGLFEAFPGQLSRDGMAVRVADALRRGALSHGPDGEPDVDLLGLDWFRFAPLDLDAARARFGLVAVSEKARAAGSVGPWEPGGISEHQYTTARAAADAADRAYDSYGAAP